MADTKITALTALTAADPANDVLPIVDVSDTTMAASGTTKKISVNNILGASGTATLASATITGDLTVATDRLKVVTGSTAIQTGATTQLQFGTTSWPSFVIGKSGSRSLFGNTGEVIIWNETAAAIGNYSTLFVAAKTGSGATTMGGLQIRAGIENASNMDGFVSLWTSNNTAGGFVERYKIDSTGVATWSNVGGVAGTAMTLNSTGLGIAGSPVSGNKLFVEGSAQIGSSSTIGTNRLTIDGLGTVGNVPTIRFRSAGAAKAYVGLSGAYLGDTSTDLLLTTDAAGASVKFGSSDTGTVKMTLDTSGNLGVGVIPSATWASNRKALQIGGLASGAVALNGTAGSGEIFFNSFFNSSTQNICVVTGGTGKYDFNVSTVGAHSWSVGTGTAGNAFSFTQAMTLDASGNLLVGTTSMPSGVVAARLVAKSTSADWTGVIWNSNATPYGVRIQHDTDSNNTGNEFLNCLGAANLRASIRSNGGIANYQANDVNLSDSRLKTDIKPLASYWNKIKSLELVTFKYKDQTHSDDNIGLIAQQVESVAPELVDADGFGNTPEDGVPLKTIYTTDLYHAAIKALQEAMTRIEALEAKLA